MPTTAYTSAISEWARVEPQTTPAETSISPEDDNPQLSDREHEIMHWVGHGKTNLEIGMILGISQFTVKNHLQRIFRKIDVCNRAQAITRILTLGRSAQLQ